MSEFEPNQEKKPGKSGPKRLEKKSHKGLIIALVSVAGAAALLAGGYFGLSTWVRDNGALLPGTTVAGMPGGQSVDIGRMDAQAAKQFLSDSLDKQFQDRSLTVNFGGQSATLTGDLLATDPDAPVDSALAEKAAQPLYSLGLLWLGVGSGSEHTVSAVVLSDEGKTQVQRLADNIAEALYVAPVDFTYELTETSVELTRGTDGQGVDKDALVEEMTNALLSGQKTLEVTPTAVPGAELTGESLSKLLYVEPQSPSVGADGKLTPTVVGQSVDAAEAQTILDQTAPGEVCSIPLEFIQPDLGEAEKLLYRDLLSSSDTYMAGTEYRRTNIRLAAKAVDGTVVMPGAVFSYNETVGQRTAAKGYKPATVYVGGEDKQELGGGICQLASALYNCTLYANLEIVKRTNHRFAVTYVPYGLDATVAWPSVDYKFRNNTNYPIKISATTEGNNLHVKFYGTKENDNRVEMKTVQLSKTPFTTVYQIDNSLAAGQTKNLVHAYTGYKYQSYRVVYDGNGKQLSKEFEAASTYAFRNKVIGVSPYDAAKYGLEGGIEAPPSASPSVEPTLPVDPGPSAEPTPPVIPEPTPSTDPIPTDPAATRQPDPIVTEPPATQQPEPTPEPTPEPIPTPAPEATPEPITEPAA